MNTKNVIKKKSPHISVQDDLYREILVGFGDIKEKTEKDKNLLSTLQKVRVSNVASVFLKNESTNYFTETWIKKLSYNINLDDIKRVFLEMKLSKEEDEIEVEETEEEKKNPFGFQSVIRVYNAIYAVKDIIKILNDIKNLKISKMTSDMENLDKNGVFGQRMKRVLLMEHFKAVMIDFLQPMMGSLCSVIFNYYDSKLIPVIGQKIEHLKEQGVKLLAKGGTGLFPIVGAWAVALWDFYDAGVSIFDEKSDVWDAVYYATSGLLNVAGGVASMTGAGYLVQSGITALKGTVGGARLVSNINEALTFSEEEQNDLRSNIQELIDEKIYPILDTFNKKIDDIEKNIYSLEKKGYDYFFETFDFSTRAKETIETLDQGANVVSRGLQGLTQSDVRNSQDFSYNRGSITFQPARGDSQYGLFLRDYGNIGKMMGRRHSVKYNFYVSDENLEMLKQNLFGFKEIKQLIDCIDQFFEKIYTVMYNYFVVFTQQYVTIIDDIKTGKQSTKGGFNFQRFSSIENILEWFEQKIIKIEQRVSGQTNFNMPITKKQNISTGVTDTSKLNIWFLSKDTLRPFVPKFIDGYLDGFELTLQNTQGETKYIDVNLRKALKTKTGFASLLANGNNHSSQYDDEYNYIKYTEFFDGLANSKIDNKYPTEQERLVEKEINQNVTEIHEKILMALL